MLTRTDEARNDKMAKNNSQLHNYIDVDASVLNCQANFLKYGSKNYVQT